ncbi:TetR/AcrR family transcriptional regulator [Mycobacteroides abscessus]|uniref:TetR/AcrR family transcriptional regulator n=1 Tax=Mycobacteroides abscessus TaxID=36809 RepID=UPI0002683A48|nr:TetR/AcrR family transcriptional regulator [Mycobacteroides abscessus]AMU65162.1 TetR family transcriptional regulator [Mycobacteroides abscessus]ANO13721.1 TetR family transcriptional regulator [Mycobacteroides abscessus]ARQ63973.1 TetR family transcriptional regulator [Mycobacteroides abscessus subsp. massiliense]EIU02306.1 regulatory protein, TetR family [Mycobacteroides abscessus 4S-0726-RB]EIV13892.1 regulatory protein, TetR family [Mycobacteroides abscessus 4S-0206]
MVARGETRSAALLAVALQVLIRDGYDRFSMDSVAAVAHASKTTIYRRWSNKAELIKAALDAHDASFNDEVFDTGGLRTDLIATMGMLRRKAQALPPTLYPDLIRAMEHDETLSDAIHRHLADPGLSPFDAPLSRAVGRGEAGVDVDRQLIHDVAEAMLTHRLTLGGPLDDAFIGRLVDDVLLVLIRPGAR